MQILFASGYQDVGKIEYRGDRGAEIAGFSECAAKKNGKVVWVISKIFKDQEYRRRLGGACPPVKFEVDVGPAVAAGG